MAYVKKSGSFGKKKSFGSRTYGAPSGASAERFQATCSQCHKVCEVPFRPNGEKPVYCRDCHHTQEGSAPTSYAPARHTQSSDIASQFDMLNTKLDRLLRAVEGRSRS